MGQRSTIEVVLKNDLSTIITACNNLFKNVVSIILYGSYGRNEGAWLKKGKEYFPYNDYDILIIDQFSSVPQEEIEQLRQYLAKAIGINFIDISVFPPNKLKHMALSIFSYDLKYASRVIYGDSTILSYIPDMDAKRLPLKEGEILFFTRLWTFIGLPSVVKRHFTKEETLFFNNQMAKALLAVVDVILLMKRSYHYSYKKRLEILQTLVPDNIWIRKQDLSSFRWALNEKLHPKVYSLSHTEAKQRYTKVAEIYRYYMLYFLSIYYNKQFQTIERFCKFYQKNPIVIGKRILYALLNFSLKYEKRYVAKIVQMSLLSIILNESEHSSQLLYSAKLLKRFAIDITNKEFVEIKKIVSLFSRS